jgi:homoserine kinase
MVRVQVPATSANMGPGFDTLGIALQLYNTVEMDEIDEGLVIEIEGEGADKIPRDSSNIVYQAANTVFKQVNFVPKGIRIKLVNNIPVARGLGSSAAAIVGGIVAANFVSGEKLAEKDLLAIATSIEGHPDNVAPALLGGIVVSAMDDEDVKYIKITPPSQLKCIVAIPDFHLSTSAARDVLPTSVSMQDAVFNIGRASLLVGAFISGDLSLLSVAMDDKLHQPYRSNLVPGMKKVFAAAKLAGARGVALSGAGPTLIAFADKNIDLITKVMKETFTENGVKVKVLILEPNPIGARSLVVKK